MHGECFTELKMIKTMWIMILKVYAIHLFQIIFKFSKTFSMHMQDKLNMCPTVYVEPPVK